MDNEKRMYFNKITSDEIGCNINLALRVKKVFDFFYSGVVSLIVQAFIFFLAGFISYSWFKDTKTKSIDFYTSVTTIGFYTLFNMLIIAILEKLKRVYVMPIFKNRLRAIIAGCKTSIDEYTRKNTVSLEIFKNHFDTILSKADTLYDFFTPLEQVNDGSNKSYSFSESRKIAAILCLIIPIREKTSNLLTICCFGNNLYEKIKNIKSKFVEIELFLPERGVAVGKDEIENMVRRLKVFLAAQRDNLFDGFDQIFINSNFGKTYNGQNKYTGVLLARRIGYFPSEVRETTTTDLDPFLTKDEKLSWHGYIDSCKS